MHQAKTRKKTTAFCYGIQKEVEEIQIKLKLYSSLQA